MSIRNRLLAGTAIGVALAFAIGAILIYTITRTQLSSQFDDNLAARARSLAALIEQDGNTIETDLGREELATEFHQLWTLSGTPLRRSRSLAKHDLARTANSIGSIAMDQVTLPDGRTGRQAAFVFRPVQDLEDAPPNPPATLVLAVARDTDELDATIARLGRVLVIVGFAMTLVCVALLAIVVRLGLRPVTDLARSISELREGDLAKRIDGARTPQELRPVVDRLNELLRRLEAAFSRERELTAEVAHELRTPIAGLRATIEVALDRVRTPERYRSALDDCLAICIQTERVVESLLSLARLDAGMVAVKREPVDLDEIVRSVIAARGKVAIETELAAGSLATDPDKLRVIVQNLVDNAISYAEPGGAIRVETTDTTLVVSNPTSITDASRVFERFWRADQARSAGAHAGLGLPLCKKLVELLGGTIRADARDRRFSVTVVLPAATSDANHP